ncbi:succinate dehydrogenase assembly factor 2 [Aquibium carbonis]|uniref:FAD assembly factor SdhE n=2 Tax=Aquibium carbonis TaxID=2495581 RepID=A0A3R9YT43_9HYPH|nr:succinate dehydrogenase assembly factor 2 [Aquibium carbonis]
MRIRTRRATTGTMISSGTLSIRRKKALYRAQHRGMREMDLLLGTFAAASLDQMSAAELDEFEGLLDILDADFLKWLTGEEPVPARHDTDLFRRIRAFRQVMPF